MKYYRFSPILQRDTLFRAIYHLHYEGLKLCKQIYGQYLPIVGDIGIFCHYDNEYEYLIKLQKEYTTPDNPFREKYFKLKQPIVIPKKHNIPGGIYTHFYVRKPDPYRHHVGDIDVYMEPEKYNNLKKSLTASSGNNIRILTRPDLDLVELHHPDSDVLTYISTYQL